MKTEEEEEERDDLLLPPDVRNLVLIAIEKENKKHAQAFVHEDSLRSLHHTSASPAFLCVAFRVHNPTTGPDVGSLRVRACTPTRAPSHSKPNAPTGKPKRK
jgi:hypothetical protein